MSDAADAPNVLVVDDEVQIRRFLPEDLPMFHPVELVDASIRGIDPISPRD